MKLGSLFDGSGGFPLAGSLCGIDPAWASEVEPYPIAVTRSRFPNMKHLGDISKINGAEVEPVDIITFGSPCQDLSVAGKRAGLKHEANGDEETTRSGLFMEAVRIIREMKEATHGRFPSYALWENVPGAFSSNGGEDFRIVLEELIKIVEPTAVMPAVPKNGWPYADSYCGDGWSLAYRVFDAQYWGVPQRRRRIHLVLDFRGERAREVLFEREGVRWYFTPVAETREENARDVGNGVETADRVGTVKPVCFGISSFQSNAMLSDNPHSGIYEAKTSRTLDLNGGNPACNQGGICIAEPIPYTLKIRSGCEGGGNGALIQTDKSATLATNNDQYLFQPAPISFQGKAGAEASLCVGEDVAASLVASKELMVAYSAGFCPEQSAKTRGIGYEAEMAPTLRAGVTPGVCVKTYDARGNGDGETVSTITGDHENRVTDYTSVVVHGVERKTECLDVGFFNSYEEQSPTLLARGYKDPHLVAYPKDAIRYIVRRLTPTECARLQGFADRWGDIDPKTEFSDEEYRFWLEVRNTHATVIGGREAKEYTKAQMLKWYNGLQTDSSEYKMWGNGIALPPALYCMQGITDVLQRLPKRALVKKVVRAE